MTLSSLLILFAFMFLSLDQVRGEQNLKQLEERLEEINESLEQLATLSLQSGVGPIGERSAIHDSPDVTEWFKVTFDSPSDIDQVVIVPALWRNKLGQFLADGFPEEFHLEVGYGDEDTGEVMARYSAEDNVLPRVAPLVMNVSAKQAKWVKVVATKLHARDWDGAFVFQLSEILVFNGMNNIALHQVVTHSSEQNNVDHGARRKEYMVDGNIPYIMDSATKEVSKAYRFRTKEKEPVNFTVDLGRELPVSRFLYHTLKTSDTIPQANRPDFGLPRKMQLYGSTLEDFSDAFLLVEYEYRSVFDYAPIIHLSFPERSCRFVKLCLQKHDYISKYETYYPFYFFTCAEVELLSRGENVMKGLQLKSDFKPTIKRFKLSNMTDGLNGFGKILPEREWLGQLARRHRLERERPLVIAQINKHYAQQEVNVRRLQWLLAILIMVVGLWYFLSRLAQVRQISTIRKRFAADLHDELGANLHAIGILSDVAEDCIEKHDEQHLYKTIKEIRDTTERTANSVRNSIYSEEGRADERGFEADMERIAHRMFEGMNYQVTVHGEEFLARLSARKRHDLFLFYKECLANISRHSSATSFSAEITASEKNIVLAVADNGVGDDNAIQPPDSLMRRAKLLKAKLHYTSSTKAPTGVNVELQLHPKRNTFF